MLIEIYKLRSWFTIFGPQYLVGPRVTCARVIAGMQYLERRGIRVQVLDLGKTISISSSALFPGVEHLYFDAVSNSLCNSSNVPINFLIQSNQGASALAMIFHTLNIFFGLSGNLLTLLSIPYARRQRRFGFQARDYFEFDIIPCESLGKCRSVPLLP